MCGRYILDAKTLALAVKFAKNSNIRVFIGEKVCTPGAFHPVMDCDFNLREAFWRYSTRRGYFINIRGESLISRGSQRSERLVVPVTRYLEYTSLRECHEIGLAEGTFYLAGVANARNEFAVVTRPAHKSISYIHGRMPILLEPGQINRWFSDRFEDCISYEYELFDIGDAQLRFF